MLYLCIRKQRGTIAQLVEQWTENPCVASSNLAGTTEKLTFQSAFFCFIPETKINIYFINFSTTSAASISIMQRKCFLGQSLNPNLLQGRHLTSLRSTI